MKDKHLNEEDYNKDIFMKKIDSLDDTFFLRQSNSIMAEIKGTSEKPRGLRAFMRLISVDLAVPVVILGIFVSVICLNFVDNDVKVANNVFMTEQDIADDMLLMEIDELDDASGISGLEIFVELTDDADYNGIGEQGALKTRKTIKA